MKYEHSFEFSRLKNQQETIRENLSSYQYLKILDDLIYNSLFCIIEGTRFTESFFSQILGWQTLNPKRKICGVGKEKLSAYIVTFLLLDSPVKKLEILKRIRFDRTILLECLRTWLSTLDGYKELSIEEPTIQGLRKLAKYHSVSLVRDNHSVHSTFTQTEYWFMKANEFKTLILEKYNRLCLNAAQRDYVELQGKVNLDDIIQTYLFVALKAIDRCDTNKGVLTSFIQTWLLSAKNVVIDKYIDKQDNTSIEEIEDVAIEVPEDKTELVLSVKLIAKIFDPEGYGRLSLGIQDVLSTEDTRLIHASVNN